MWTIFKNSYIGNATPGNKEIISRGDASRRCVFYQQPVSPIPDFPTNVEGTVFLQKPTENCAVEVEFS